MTLAEVCDFVIRHSQVDLDLYIGEYEPGAGLDASIRGLVNRGTRKIAEIVELYDPAILLTLAAGDGSAASPVDLHSLAKVAKRVIEPYYVVIAGSPLLDAGGRDPGLHNEEQLARRDPTWRAATQGRPTLGVWSGPTTQKLYLYQPCDAATAALGGHYISGTFLPADLSTAGADDGVQIPLPLTLHEMLCWWCAEKGRKGLANEGSAWTSIREYSREWADELIRIKEAQTRAKIGSMAADAGWATSELMES